MPVDARCAAHHADAAILCRRLTGLVEQVAAGAAARLTSDLREECRQEALVCLVRLSRHLPGVSEERRCNYSAMAVCHALGRFLKREHARRGRMVSLEALHDPEDDSCDPATPQLRTRRGIGVAVHRPPSGARGPRPYKRMTVGTGSPRPAGRRAHATLISLRVLSVEESALGHLGLTHQVADRGLQWALCQLTPRELQVLDLGYRLDLDTKEIAARLGISEQAVRQARSRALRRLHALLGVGGGGESPR